MKKALALLVAGFSAVGCGSVRREWHGPIALLGCGESRSTEVETKGVMG